MRRKHFYFVLLVLALILLALPGFAAKAAKRAAGARSPVRLNSRSRRDAGLSRRARALSPIAAP